MVQPTSTFQGDLLVFSYSLWQPTFKVIVEPINEVSARSEVYQADLFGPRVDQDVLVFQVAVENPSVVAQKNCLEDLGNVV